MWWIECDTFTWDWWICVSCWLCSSQLTWRSISRISHWHWRTAMGTIIVNFKDSGAVQGNPDWPNRWPFRISSNLKVTRTTTSYHQKTTKHIDWLIDDHLYSAILRSLEQTHCARLWFYMSDKLFIARFVVVLFLNIHRSGVLTALTWLVPHETAAISAQVLCTPYNHAPCHFMQSHIRKVYACLAVTCHLHFWQNDRDLLRATAVTRGWNGYRH